MADKNIQMTQRNADNTGWDNLYPVTKDSNVIITDPNNRFAGTKLDQVLDELFTFANDGKTQIANAITAKGVSASPTEAFASLATKIGQISTGKKWASGQATPSSQMASFYKKDGSSYSTYPLTISGLDFKPSLIVLDRLNTDRTMFFANGDWSSTNYIYQFDSFGDIVILRNTYPVRIDVGTFTLPANGYYQMTWVAIE